MLNGVIIVNRYCKIPAMINQAERLKKEFELKGVNVKIIENGYNFVFTSDGSVNLNLKNLDFCLFLDKDRYTAEVIEKSGVRVFNPSNSIVVCDDKVLTYLNLLNNQITMPKTLPSPLNYTASDVSYEEVDKIAKFLGYPVVVKLSYSSMGKGVFLANNRQELYELCNKYKSQAKLYQEFISSSLGRDVRIITVGGKYLCGYERNSHGKDFRSNVALGGNGVKINPPKEFINFAEKVAKILNLDYMGIDLMYGKNGEPILCEVNSNAFFEMAEEITNINVAKSYVEYIINTIGGNDQ